MRKVLFIFGELNDLDVDWLLSAGKKQLITPGTALISEGKPVDALFIVIEGLFNVTVAGMGSEKIAQLVAGEIAGEMSFIEARPPSATVRAETNGIVLAIPRVRLAQKLKEDTGFAARFYRALAIFLSFRLRLRNMQYAQLVQGKSGRPATPAQAAASEEYTEEADELDANILDTVYLAGARFDRMLRKLVDR